MFSAAQGLTLWMKLPEDTDREYLKFSRICQGLKSFGRSHDSY
jgi:hypothetical protein